MGFFVYHFTTLKYLFFCFLFFLWCSWVTSWACPSSAHFLKIDLAVIQISKTKQFNSSNFCNYCILNNQIYKNDFIISLLIQVLLGILSIVDALFVALEYREEVWRQNLLKPGQDDVIQIGLLRSIHDVICLLSGPRVTFFAPMLDFEGLPFSEY